MWRCRGRHSLTVALVGRVQSLDVPRKHPTVHAPRFLRDLHIKFTLSCVVAIRWDLSRGIREALRHGLAIVSLTPGSGFIPNIRSTVTCVCPPPMSTTSRSTGVVGCISGYRLLRRFRPCTAPPGSSLGLCQCRSSERASPGAVRGVCPHLCALSAPCPCPAVRQLSSLTPTAREAQSTMADAARLASSNQASTTGAGPKEVLDNQVLHLLYVREVRARRLRAQWTWYACLAACRQLIAPVCCISTGV